MTVFICTITILVVDMLTLYQIPLIKGVYRPERWYNQKLEYPFLTAHRSLIPVHLITVPTTSSAIAIAAVSPGDSIPIRLIHPGYPLSSSCEI